MVHEREVGRRAPAVGQDLGEPVGTASGRSDGRSGRGERPCQTGPDAEDAPVTSTFLPARSYAIRALL